MQLNLLPTIFNSYNSTEFLELNLICCSS